MANELTCCHCGKSTEKEALQDENRCPHCGKAAEAQRALEIPPHRLERRPASGVMDPQWLSRASIMLGIGIILTFPFFPLGYAFMLLGALVAAIAAQRMWRRREAGLWFLAMACLPALGVLLCSPIFWVHLMPRYERYRCYREIGTALYRWSFLILSVGIAVNNVTVWLRQRRANAPRLPALAGLILGLCGAVPMLLLTLHFMSWTPHDSSGGTRTLGDCRNINTAIQLFHKDTGTWPIYVSSNRSSEFRVDYLFGNMGEMPEFSDEVRGSWGRRSEDMYFILVTNGRESLWYKYGREFTAEERKTYKEAGKEVPPAGGWTGPYLPYVTDDPWGFAYLISVSGFANGTKPNYHVYCLSAGPNGIVDTPTWATETHGDDIGYRTN